VPHSRAFNALRREFYRRGRLLGLTPREAGHATSDTTFAANTGRALQLPPNRPVVELPPPIERQRDAEAARGHVITPDYFNRHGAYVKVRVREHDPDTGEKKQRMFELVFDRAEAPTRVAIADRVRRILEDKSRVVAGSDRYVFDGFSVIGNIETVPDRTTMPSRTIQRDEAGRPVAVLRGTEVVRRYGVP
jgi:hypothetical protein